MTLVIQKRNGKRRIVAFDKKLAWIPDGLDVKTSDFVQPVLHEGTPLGMDTDGYARLVKTAVLTASANNAATTLTVKKGHNFKVGDNVWAKAGGKCYDITDIATNSSDTTSDDITISTTLGVALNEGETLYEGASTGATKGAFKFAPICMAGASYDVADNDNLIVEAVTMGQVVRAALDSEVILGSEVETALKHINII